ncbi:hypothetical protein Ddye_013575 [Dipteronia dyeriana]|uniref:Uncharacterized protein n=1 Tax=Dipteronia dyeriana TaxID=168575 RepID=A0AAD9X6I8_9ROSI|nr:hypothetical protein Ddye_013575 [Dipteronia dyeriana]
MKDDDVSSAASGDSDEDLEGKFTGNAFAVRVRGGTFISGSFFAVALWWSMAKGSGHQDSQVELGNLMEKKASGMWRVMITFRLLQQPRVSGSSTAAMGEEEDEDWGAISIWSGVLSN